LTPESDSTTTWLPGPDTGVLRPGGLLIGIAPAPSDAQAQRHQVRGPYFIVEPDCDALTRLARPADAGKLRPAIGEEFGIADATAAFDTLQHTHHTGKVVLKVG
jgi:NADPH:quinone reductase-like Zn-dependent oxidoreductase